MGNVANGSNAKPMSTPLFAVSRSGPAVLTRWPLHRTDVRRIGAERAVHRPISDNESENASVHGRRVNGSAEPVQPRAVLFVLGRTHRFCSGSHSTVPRRWHPCNALHDDREMALDRLRRDSRRHYRHPELVLEHRQMTHACRIENLCAHSWPAVRMLTSPASLDGSHQGRWR